MADFARIIDENQCLQEYFRKFPKQLMELLNEKKVGNFSGSSDVLVNFNLLEKFLASEDSPFEVRTVQEFVETLDILGFSRGVVPEHRERKHVVYRFFNSNFKRDQPVPDDLYKLKKDKSQYGVKNAKRMLNTNCIKFMQTLLEKHHAPPLKITKLDLSHLKLQFALEKQLDVLCENASVIEYSVVDPGHSNEIAGYYGAVPLDSLKFAFQNYFPIYNVAAESVVDEPAAIQQFIWEMPTEEVNTEVNDQIVPIKKHYSKKLRDETKENKQALAFLHQESMAIQSTEE